LSDFIFHILIDKAFHAARKEREQLLPLIKDVSKILVWVIGVFWILGSVFNVNIPALVTGLGIGGVAIALAAKESVENFFAAFTILAEKPFENGDIIRMDSIEGTVEKVGFRSTKLRTADGSLFVIPNKNLVGNNLENLTERSIRRIKVQVGFQYSNISPAQLESVISLIGKMLNTIPYLIDEKEILLDSFNDNGFVLTIFYRLPQTLPEGLQLLQVKHDINMKIYETVNAFLPNGVQKYQLVTQ
jgi:MscS family membrane protein